MNNGGWICLHRKIIDWERYKDNNTKVVFLHCLLKANYKPQKWQSIVIGRGSFVTSYKNLAIETNLSVQQIRTAIKKLKSFNTITSRVTSQYSIISIINYDLYQSEQQTGNKQINKQLNTQINNHINKPQSKEPCEYPPSTNTLNNTQLTSNLTSKLTTTNNINKENNINLSLSINGEKKVTDDEREILKNYVKKTAPKVSNVNAYVRKIIENNDHIEILENEKARIERAKARASIPPPVKPPPPTEAEIQAGLELLRNAIGKRRKGHT